MLQCAYSPFFAVVCMWEEKLSISKEEDSGILNRHRDCRLFSYLRKNNRIERMLSLAHNTEMSQRQYFNPEV